MPRNTASNSRSQLVECYVAADLDVQAEFDAHVLHDLAALLHHLLFELERRNAEGQQSADLRVAVEHHGGDAVAHEHVRARQARRDPRPRRPRACSVRTTFDMSGFQPCLNASSVMYFSMEPMLTAPRPSFSVQAPSHRRSCGQMRPHISGSELV